MKSVTKQNTQVVEDVYPMLKMNVESKAVVLCTSATTGTVVNVGNSKHALGQTLNNVCQARLVTYHDTIELSNI